MLVIEVLTSMLVVVSLVLMAVALYVGLLGALGLIRFVRYDHCGLLGVTSAAAPLGACVRCRHGQLFHPHVFLHHAHVVPERSPRAVSAAVPRTNSTQKVSRQPARVGARSHESARGPSWR
jgi:hypothetical protein